MVSKAPFVSTNFPGWCCCQEILIHDSFLQTGDRGKPAGAGTLQFALSFWLRQHLAAQACRRQCGRHDPCVGEAVQLTEQILSLAPWGCSWMATIFASGCPLEMLHTKGPCKKWFRVPVTKMKLQCYGDAAVLCSQVCH